MSLSRFDSTGELIEFVSFSSEVARGQDETAHLFEFSNTTSLGSLNSQAVVSGVMPGITPGAAATSSLSTGVPTGAVSTAGALLGASGGLQATVSTTTVDNPQHVFLVIGPQSKEARVDSYIASMALKSLQRG